MLSYICTIFIPFYFAVFIQHNWCGTQYLYAHYNEQFSFVTFCKLFLSIKIIWDKIYAIINVSLIIHYYNTRYVMIKWKTLTLSCNCPLVTSFFIHRSFVLWTKFFYLLLVHTLYSSTPTTTLLYILLHMCVSMQTI